MATNDTDVAKPKGKDRASKRGPLGDTGLHVLKGAVVSVLGPRAAVTSSVDFSKPTQAVLIVQLSEGKGPSREEVDSIQDAANLKIKEDVDVKQFKCARQAAEEKYRANPVNHTFIFDAFPVPASVTELALVEIADWNVNCCPFAHTAKTGELKALVITKTSYKEKKNLAEFHFTVGDDAVAKLASAPATANNKTKKDAAASAPSLPAAKNLFSSWKPGGTSAVQDMASQLMDEEVLPALARALIPPAPTSAEQKKDKGGVVAEPTADQLLAAGVLKPEALQALRNQLVARLERRLNSFQSTAYANGFTAQIITPPTVSNFGI